MRIPSWVVKEIREARDNRYKYLNLDTRISKYITLEAMREIPDGVFELSYLNKLNLSANLLRNIPAEISELQNLTQLNLSNNQLTAFPESVTILQNLTHLDLSHNRIHEIPASIFRLKNLISLNLSGNILVDLPESIERMQNLTHLDLSDNQLLRLPESIGLLRSLTSLNLRTNRLIDLPESFSQLILTELNLNENPQLKIPPQEVIIGGVEAIQEYFRQLREEGEDYLYEAKLLIVGEGGAGKTSLAKKIVDLNYKLKDETSTQGVDVIHWSFPISEDRVFRVNIWDFGGQ